MHKKKKRLSGRFFELLISESNNFVITKLCIMEVSIIQIGNSKGLRLSKTIIDKYQIKEKLEMILENDHIILRPFDEVRKGWSEAFAEMHDAGDDQLYIDDVFDDENFDEWN